MEQATPVSTEWKSGTITLTNGVDPSTLRPTITTQPQDVTWTYGDSAAKTLTVAATTPENSSGELAYQWYKGTDASDKTPDDSKKVANGTTASLSLSVPTSWTYDQTDYYFCVVTNTYNGKTYSATSNVAAVTYAKAQLPTATLEGAADLKYDGTQKTVTVKVGDLAVNTDYTVSGDTTGTNAGDYNVTVKPVETGNYTGNAQTLTWSIAPKPLQATSKGGIVLFTTSTEPLTLVGADLVTVEGQVSDDGSTLSYAYSLSGAGVTLNGDKLSHQGQPTTQDAILTVTVSAGNNYVAATANVPVKVQNKNLIPEDNVNFAAKDADNLTYSESGIALKDHVTGPAFAEDVSVEAGGSWSYKVDGAKVELESFKLTDAKTYNVTAEYSDSKNTASKTVQIVVKPQPITINAENLIWTATTAYTGNKQTVTISNLPAHVTASYTGNEATDAGENYAAVATLSPENGNYTVSETTVNHTWSIAKAANNLTASVPEQSVRYNDSSVHSIAASAITFTGGAPAGVKIESIAKTTESSSILNDSSIKVENGAAQFALIGADTFTANQSATLTITYSTTNYENGTVTVKVTVVDKYVVDDQVTFDPEAPTATYNGTPRAVSENAASFGGQKDGNGAISYKYNTGTDGAWSDTAPTNAGTYKVQATYEDNSQRGKAEATYTISKAELTITGATVTPKDYDTTTDATVSKVTFGNLQNSEELALNTDYTVTGEFADANAGEKSVTVTVALVENGTVSKNYTLPTATFTTTGTINKKNVTPTLTLDPATSAFNNAVQTPTVKVTYDTDKEMAASEYTVTYAEGRTDVGTYAVTVAPKDSSNYTFTELSKDFVITQAAKADITIAKVHKAGDSVTIDLPTLENPGTPGATYTVGDTVASILTEKATTDGNKLSYTIMSDAAADATGSIEVTVTSGNYAEYKITVDITVTTKDIPNATVENLTKTYDGVVLTADSFQKSSGGVDGNWTITTNATSTNASNVPYDVVLTFAPTDTTAYVAVDVPAQVTINKAQPVVQPIFTPITEAGKTLADAQLGLESNVTAAYTPGTIAWDDGNDTIVVANQSYSWTFTPDDTTNYETATGTLIPFVQNTPDSEPEEPSVPPILPPSGGNGSGSTGTGGSGSGSGNQGGSTTNPDQSVTNTTTDRDGNVTTTTTYPDGSQSIVEMKTDGTIISTDTDAQGNTATVTQNPDGSSVKTVENIDGSSSIQNTTADGQTSAMVNLPSETVEAANASGAPASLPMDAVTATKDSATAPVVMVNTANDEPVKVEIPVSNANNGTVAVLVKADGTEEIIKTTALTGDGVAVTVSSGDTVKIIDNTKTFSDTATHWGSDAVTFVAARELFSGTSETQFSPDDNMTRGMLMTVLARYENVDTSGGSVWYEKGVAWAVTQGLSDGTNPNGQISREQLATIIYRYAQAKGIDTTAGGSLERFPDAGSVSDWAREAMSWAVGNGIISGVGGVTLDPSGNATRAQVATILMRFSEKFPA